MNQTNSNDKKFQAKRKERVSEQLIYGKVPPQAKDLEEAVLGAMMLQKDAYDAVADMLKPEVFYVDAHQRIYKAIQSLALRNQPMDILTITEELRSKEELDLVGGPYYITKLTNAVVSAAHIEAHSKIIMQKFVQRELIRIGGEIVHSAYEEMADAFELLSDAEEQLAAVGNQLDVGEMVGIDSVLVKAVQKIEEWRHMDSSVTGVTSGFDELDHATRGWQDGDLIIIAARPSVGKTAFALNLIRNAAMSFNQAKGPKKSVAVWSLEMKSLMLVLRMLAAESKELLNNIQTGRLDEAQMKRLYRDGIQKLATLNIRFDDKTGLTIQKLRSKARRMKAKNNLGLIVVDYLQLMTPEERSGTREQEVSKISRNLKNLAQELEVPIIALSQLSRDIEKRSGAQRQPQLSDLRESGSIEQDADVVGFLWGPTDEEIGQDATLLNRRYFKIAKQRNGVLISMDLDFKNEIQFFEQASKVMGGPLFNSNVESAGLPSGSWRPVDRPYRDYTEPERNEPDNMPF